MKDTKQIVEKYLPKLIAACAIEKIKRVIAQNEDKWITKYDKQGKPYKIKIDGEDLSEEEKQKLKDYKDLRNSYKKVISELKYEQLNMNNFYVTNKSRKGFYKHSVDPISIEIEESNRKFNRLIQDMKNYLTTDKTELPEDKIDEWEKQLEKTFVEIYDYKDADEKSSKWAEALWCQSEYINLNNKIKSGEYKNG